MNASEAARRLGINRSLVTRYIEQGRLQAARVGSGWQITESDLAAFAAQPRPVGVQHSSTRRRRTRGI